MLKFIPVVIFLSLLAGCAGLQQKQIDKTNAVLSEQENSRLTTVQKFLVLGREYQKKNELVEALNAYEKAIELAPTHYEAYNNMGIIYFMIGEDELGIQFLSEAIRLAPDVSSLQNNLGYALFKQGRYHEAAEVLERAALLDPSNLYARNNLSAVYREMGCQDGVLCGKRQDTK